MPDWLSKLLDSGPAWAVAGAGFGQVLTWMHGRSRLKADVSLEGRKLDSSERSVSFAQLTEVVRIMREDMTSLRHELEEERKMRKRAESCLRAVQMELHTLRTAMQARGISLPIEATGG